jgi:dihydrofolate reductase
MRKLIVLTFVSLDGIMQAPGGPTEDTSNGFTQGGWSVGYWDNFMGQVMMEQMDEPFDLLLGFKTYEIFASFWPQVPEDPAGAILNKAKKYVVSKSHRKLVWNNSELVTGAVIQEIKKLKGQEGPELQVHGSSGLIQTLLKHDVVDVFRLKIFPVTLGAGKRLFGEGAIPASFKLLDCKASTTGVIVATYVRDGEIETGSF